MPANRPGNSPNLLPLPDFPVETPCFVVLEDAVLHNLRQTVRHARGVQRLMPHLKTHRAPWLVELMLAEGIQAFKAATPAEVEMAAEAGARYVVWAYPTVNTQSIARVARVARSHPGTRISALVDSQEGCQLWLKEMEHGSADNLGLRIDLDVGLGRTGVVDRHAAWQLARQVQNANVFDGWHAYDGHIHAPDRKKRFELVSEIATELRLFLSRASETGLKGDLIAGGSYSFDIWPREVAQWVSPGSWTYSSAQHETDLADLDWHIGCYVLATVISVRRGTATLDAGSKAISPDKPLTSRFRGAGAIQLMNEEHVVVSTDELRIGQVVALVPMHSCTSAYLYDRALVKKQNGDWEYRAQLGASR
jgi:3-hydroxy-D-aspartate aldolase